MGNQTTTDTRRGLTRRTTPDATVSDVYILHFDSPYWMNCRHYVGWTSLGHEARIAKHMNGKGSLLVGYALKHGHSFVVGLIEQYATKQLARWREVKLKGEKNLSRHCSVCKERKGK